MNYIQFLAKVSPLVMGREILIAELAEIGFESFVDTEDGFEAYIQETDFDESNIEQISLLSNEEFKIDYTINKIAQQNWNEQWEKSFDPIFVDEKCMIRAPFHEKPTDNVIDIIIEPKMSFGTGHHETTHLIVSRLLNLDLNDKSVLDIGCGTGILAILAKKRNCGKVLAIDNDEWAYTNSVENCERNNVDIEVILGDANQIKTNKFDVIIANINRNILLRDMHFYADALNINGLLLLSGFFSIDKEVLTEEANKIGMTLIFENTKNEWTMLEFVKK
ncbi:MAG: 50S ribosomal protein L11 methyltransferase [Flavobacteriales bacterium]|nr:50S ribosomal protein L11 methyltransferase [Flavobacteriales bacterium]MCW8912216.1 50S ribosomal protein L11 methyltransferase [Flavobacteriales bacterium]MCW8937992.1 50S ribosomal protein L11 methyltransferase [Flavobacteriales bacterium]MCW8941228.1 50S ribosomal protein L11 methyltransferase [Flavobacteriales bacterium]MCW8967037.1 50S ribosomal protein L11 methyltransferase [Flavobacteriales bacterium]